MLVLIVVFVVSLIIGGGWLMTSHRTQLEIQHQQYQPELAAAITRFALVTGSPEGLQKEALRTVATDSLIGWWIDEGITVRWITLDYEIIAMDVRQYTETTAKV